jgi:TRAP transporter TAXI family solute receptor
MRKIMIRNSLFWCGVSIMAVFVMGGVDEALSADGARADWPKTLIGAGGSGASTNFMNNAGMCKMISTHLGIKATPIETGPGTSTAKAIAAGEADFGVISADVAWNCWQGLDVFKSKPFQIRSFAQGYQFNFAFATTAKSGIKSLHDIRGKVCYFVDARSSFQHMFVYTLLKNLNIDPKKDIKLMSYTGMPDVVDSLKEGRADIICFPAMHPAGFYMDLAQAVDMRFVPMERDLVDKMLADIPYLVEGTVRAGTYNGIDKDVLGVCLGMGMVCRPDLPDSLVYEMTKLVYDRKTRAEWESFHAACKEYDPSDLEWWKCPVHPGAIRYYKEIGAWTDRLDKRNKQYLKIVGLDR